ncbi:MAG: helix-turn-helix domain-containing protein [Emergencia sp.]|nr:helix-turn-helix transcriptional regulator [Emergencia sp.]
MPKISAKPEKNVYYRCRENLGLTREKASELLEWISADRLEKIENERVAAPTPSEVVKMSEVYNAPDLCNYYCSHQCEIGAKYVPEVKIKDLAQIVLEMLATLNSVGERKNRLIEITADGEITDDEIADFMEIQKELERISITVESLQLWSEKMIADGKISKEKLGK